MELHACNAAYSRVQPGHQQCRLSIHSNTSEHIRLTLARGARQFVVHEALDTTFILLPSYFFSLTPITNMGASAEGAEMMTYARSQSVTSYCDLKCMNQSTAAVNTDRTGAYLLGTSLQMC